MAGSTVGIALAADGVTALLEIGDGRREVSVPLKLPPAPSDPAPALALAFEQLRDLGIGEEGASVVVALLPPLVEMRLLPLPPLDPDEALEVIRRDAGRHFLSGSSGSCVVGVAHSGSSAEGAPVLAAAASRPLVEAIYRAVSGAGWRLEAIVPAQAAWVRGTLGGKDGSRARSEAPALVIAVLDGTVHLIRIEGGEAVRLRRFPASDTAELNSAGEGGPGRVWVLSDPGSPDADRLGGALDGMGWSEGGDLGSIRSPAGVAARHAVDTDLELVPPTLAMARRDRLRRLAIRMLTAAALLLVVAAGVQLWSTSRELRVVRLERAELRIAVAPILAASDSLALMEDRLASISALEGSATGWTFALVELAVVLPSDVHVVGLQAAGDTLVIDAVGSRAGDALNALARTASFLDVRLEGAIQRDVEGGTATRERFTLSALRADGLPAAASRASLLEDQR